jgi:hypothetical protein
MSDWLSDLERKKKIEAEKKAEKQREEELKKIDEQESLRSLFSRHKQELKSICESTKRLVERTKNVIHERAIHLDYCVDVDNPVNDRIILLSSETKTVPYGGYSVNAVNAPTLTYALRKISVHLMNENEIKIAYEKPQHGGTIHISAPISIESVNEETISLWVRMVATGEEFPQQTTIQKEESQKPDSKKSNCFIATAVYGSTLAPEVMVFRRFRDEALLTSKLGTTFVNFYYSVSPPLAFLVSRYQLLRILTRYFLLEPILHLIKKEK